MSAGDRPALLLALDEAWLRPRCEAFERAHRGTQFSYFGAMAQAWVPRRNGSRTVTRASMGDVLEALDEIYGPSAQQGDSFSS